MAAIPDISFLWEQFDGPQVQGIMKAIYNYWYDMLDTILARLSNLSIDTAADEHLKTIGALMNIPWPMIPADIEKWAVFTDGFFAGYKRGFSDLRGLIGGGGVFSDLHAESKGQSPADREIYRDLLKSISLSQGEIGSLMLLDDIIAYLTGVNEEDYEWMEPEINPGGINVKIAKAQSLQFPNSTLASLKAFINGVYPQEPEVYLTLR